MHPMPTTGIAWQSHGRSRSMHSCLGKINHELSTHSAGITQQFSRFPRRHGLSSMRLSRLGWAASAIGAAGGCYLIAAVPHVPAPPGVQKVGKAGNRQRLSMQSAL